MAKLSKDEIHFFLLKLHSLTGIIPIGAFLVIHLSINSLRTVGVLPYQLSIDILNNIPFLILIEIAFSYIPLFFHSLMGIYVVHIGQTNAFRYRHKRNWLYTLQRLTGAITFVFLIYHMGTTVGAKLWEEKHHFEAAPFLDRNYTVFGKVVDGMNHVDQIKKGDSNNNGAVTEPDKIISFRSE